MPLSVDYLNFDILITRFGDQYHVFVVDAPGGDADASLVLPFTPGEIDALPLNGRTRRTRGRRKAAASSSSSSGPPTLAGLGTQLFDAVFHDDVRSVLIASQQEAAAAGKPLRIRLRFSDDTAALATLPWEILFDPLHKQYLVLSEARPIVRYLSLPRPKPPLVVQPPLRILAVLANARDHVPLDIEGEWQAVTAALADLVVGGKVVLERLESPTRRGLQQRLMGDPVHVLHFVGHGAFDTGRGQGLLAFEDAAGDADLVEAEALGVLLQNHSSLRLIYLNACEGATGGLSNVFAGVAQTLVLHGIPAALAMQDEITDEAAIELARTFYTALAAGLPVDAALTQARVALASGGSEEWVLPVLFSRSPDNRLFDLVAVLPTPACPYPGMRPFSETQAGLFFGRDKEIDQAASRLLNHPFLAVVGPSGSGKSSLVFGGILPALRRRDSVVGVEGAWQILTMRPSDSRSADGKARPREALARLVGCDIDRLAACTFAQKTLVVVDQFEEVFTLAETAEAAAFTGTLAALAGTPNLHLLLTVRADFYAEMMAMGPLWEAVKANRLELTPLGEDGLWAAIVEPAAKVGVTVDEALAVALIGDAAGERGALPLVQMTLVLLWDRVTKRELKLAAYRQMADGSRNGLQVAVDLWADNVYNNQLSAATRPIARRIFLRSIQFGQGRADTRRQQTVEELQSTSDDPQQFAAALDILAANRLLTLSGSSQGEPGQGGAPGDKPGDESANMPESAAARQVDIAHETLIAGWGMLRGWIQELRDAETLRRRLDDKAAEWVRLGRGEGGLLDEYELYEAEDWLGIAAANGLGSSPDLVLLARASRQFIDGRRQAEETARQRELDGALRLAEEAHGRAQAQATAAKRMRWLVASLGLLLVLALAAGSWIRLQSDQLADRNAALTTQTEQAQYEQRRARAGELAALAQLTMGRTQPDMALTLGQAVAGVTTTLQVDGYVLSSASAALTQAVEDAPPWIRTIRTLGTLDPGWASRWVDAGPPVPPVFDRSAGPTAAFSPDGRAIVGVTGEGDSQNNAYIWDAATGSLLATLRGHTARVYGAAYATGDTSGAARIVTASADGTARIWDARTGNQLAVLAPAAAGAIAEVTSASFSPAGDAIATTHSDGTVRIWDAATGTVRRVLQGHSYAALSAVFSPDGRQLVTSGVDRTVRLWDVASGEELRTFPGHEAIVRTAAFDPGGTRIVSASEDGTARVWDIADGRVLLLLAGHQAPVYAAGYSPDGRYILTAGEDRTARLWDANSGLPVQDFAGHSARVTAAGFSPDGTTVVTAGADRTIRLWHAPDHPDLRVLRGHVGGINAVAYSPRGDRLVSAGGVDKTARIWDVATGKEIRRLVGHTAGLTVAIFSPTGDQVATTGLDNTICIWDVTGAKGSGEGGEAQVAELHGHTKLVRALAFSPAGDHLVSASSDGTVRIWDPQQGTQQVIWDDPAVPMHAAVYSPSGGQIAFGGAGGQIRLWDTAAQTVTAVLEGHSDVVRGLAYAPDGRRLVSVSVDGTARVWELPVEGHAGGTAQLVLDHHGGTIYAASFSPDGSRIVTAGRDGTVRLWDAATGSELLSFAAHRQPVYAAAFSPDGRQVASAGDDGTIRLWPAGIERFLAIAAELKQTGARGAVQGD